MSEELSRFEQRLGYRFADRSRLETAVTHRSRVNEAGKGEHYERLEFLGDAVLGLVAAQWLFARDPSHDEGELSRRKAVLVSSGELARAAEALGLGELLRLGVGEDRSGGRSKTSLLADSLEAVFGAVFLDGGFAAARSVIEPILGARLGGEGLSGLDAKSELQEWAQASGVELPAYAVVATEGPDNARRFTVEVRLAGAVAGVGTGRSKKQAEQSAAAAALAARGRAEEPARGDGG